jgi:hypothetical protein
MTKQKYRALTGLTWNNDKRRAETGDVVDDLPLKSIFWLLEQGLIEPVTDEPAPDEGEG